MKTREVIVIDDDADIIRKAVNDHLIEVDLPSPQYILELAKSNRSECKRCNKKIQRSELRVGVINEGEWGLFTKWLDLRYYF